MQGIPDSGIRDNFCLWNPECETFACGIEILGLGNRNTAQGIRNPTNIWNPEFSKFHWQRIRNPVTGIRNPWRGIHNPRLSWIPLYGSNPMHMTIWRSNFDMSEEKHHSITEIELKSPGNRRPIRLTWFFCHRKNCPVLIVWTQAEVSSDRAIFECPWNENARTKQKQQTNGKRVIWVVYRTDTNARDFCLVKRTLGWKNFRPENSLEINRYFVFTSYCNTIAQSNNALSILGFSLSGKRRGHVWSFHSLADKTNNEYLTKPFSEVIRKSLYQKMSLILTTDIYCYRWTAHPANPLCYWLSSTGFTRG